MAKSPLLDMLRRAYALARLSRDRNMPIDELIEMPLSRRQILYGGLSLGSAVAASQIGSLKAEARSAERILIVGAGLAGLTAGYRLRQAGIRVDIVEARSTVGGRMRSLPKALGTSTTVELGGEYIDTDHTYVRELATELGLQLFDLPTSDQGLTLDTYYFEGRKVPLSEIVEAFIPLVPTLEQDIAIAESLTSPEAVALDQLSISEYLYRNSSSAVLRSFLEVAYVIEYGRNADEQSCLNLLFLIGTDPNAFSVFGSSDERFHVIGGNQQIPSRLAQRLGNSVRVGTVLESLRSRSDGRYQVSLRSDQTSTDRTYARVILTVPFSVLRSVQLSVDLPELKQQAIQELGYGTNSKLMTAYSQRIWRTRYQSTAAVYTDIGFQNTWEATRYASGNAGIVTNFTGGTKGIQIGSGAVASQAQAFRSQFETVFPGSAALSQGDALRAYWTGEAFSRGSYACYLVGQWSKFYGSEGTRVGNLFFAGEHCSLNYQGYMEGACETGELVAQEILIELNLPARPPRSRKPRRRPKAIAR